jgi:hypothetical protein
MPVFSMPGADSTPASFLVCFNYNLAMTDNVSCPECERLKKASHDAYRSWLGYRPMHTGYRPKSRWLKDDKSAVTSLERAYNLAEAKYQLHRAEHKDDSDPRDVVKNINIVTRDGRLTP